MIQSNWLPHLSRLSRLTGFSMMLLLAFLSGRSSQSNAKPMSASISSLCCTTCWKIDLSSLIYSSTEIALRFFSVRMSGWYADEPRLRGIQWSVPGLRRLKFLENACFVKAYSLNAVQYSRRNCLAGSAELCFFDLFRPVIGLLNYLKLDGWLGVADFI